MFGPDGMIYMSLGRSQEGANAPSQDPEQLRRQGAADSRHDGSAPPDNPLIGRIGYKPEIYSLGHRNQLGLIVHPETGAIWEHENGPNGGDEVNILQPGKNYGWPVVSWGRNYEGSRVSDRRTQEGMEDPLLVWIPSIAPSGMTFYTGDRFPGWKGNLFVGALQYGEIRGTGPSPAHRLQKQLAPRRCGVRCCFVDLRQRFAHAATGSRRTLLYVLTDEEDAALLRIEPAS